MISKEVIITVRKYKSNVLKMHLKLKDQKLKTITYIERLLYKNLMLTTKQKSIIDIHPEKKNESRYNTKDSHQITREENKISRAGKHSTKTTSKQQNGNKNIFIYNYLKCKWTKCSNQDTEWLKTETESEEMDKGILCK